jgi:hypothetical protein
MFITRKKTVQIITPLALAGAGAEHPEKTRAPAADTAEPTVVEETKIAVGTGVTSIEDLSYGAIDSDDPKFNAAIEELVLALNAASPGGLAEININAHGPDRVGINLLTESADGTITVEQVNAVLDVLMQFTPPVAVREYIIGGFNNNFGAGEILAAGAEAGISADFLDEMDKKIEIPGDQLDKVYG